MHALASLPPAAARAAAPQQPHRPRISLPRRRPRTRAPPPFPRADGGASYDAWPPEDATAASSALSLAPFAATPEGTVAAMLRLASFEAGEALCDLGSGDGRVLTAALSWGARHVTGWELDAELHAAAASAPALAAAARAGCATLVCGDAREATADVAAADVTTLFLLPEGIAAITPMARSRVV